MKLKISIVFLLLFISIVHSQIPLLMQNDELFLGTETADSKKEIIYSFSAVSTVWKTDDNYSSFWITTNEFQSGSHKTIGNTGAQSWYGWDFCTSAEGFTDTLGYGLYVIYCNDSNAFFYIDYRDCNYTRNYTGGRDIFVKYDDSENQFYISSYTDGPWTNIPNGTVKQIWEIKGRSQIISCFPNFWSNCLAMTVNSGFPQIVWGPHPTFTPISGYKIYRKVVLHGYNPGNPLSYSLLATVSSSTFSYIDLEYTTGGEYYDVYYYVKAYYNSTLSETTNIVGTSVNNNNYKATTPQNNYNKTESYLLNSYPNPFNPTTKIEYQIPQAGQVSIKVYNSLGSEVATLVNERQDVGKYSV